MADYKISQNRFDDKYCKALTCLANKVYDETKEYTLGYKTGKPKFSRDIKLLLMYISVLNTWVQTESGTTRNLFNYIDSEQLKSVLSSVTKLCPNCCN